MSIRKRTLNVLLGLGILVITASVAVILLWPSERTGDKLQEVLDALPLDAFGKIDNFTYTKSDRGRVLWRINAERAEYFQDRRRIALDTMDVIFYDDQGRVFTLKGAHGEMDVDTQNIEVTGGITAATSEGYQLVTGSASYDKQNGIVRTDEPVLFFGHGLTVHAVGMEVRVNDQTVTLHKAVRALIEGSEQSGPNPLSELPSSRP